ncbi:hypothetical protein GWL_09140 [Herbaspirillum sp. GW103]|nr:hypothetical protein GWL_09140 [Herbaspirillum sp. GW103]
MKRLLNPSRVRNIACKDTIERKRNCAAFSKGGNALTRI